MNKRKCDVAMAAMAAVAPRNVSGCIRALAAAVDNRAQRSSIMVDALQALRCAGVFVDAFVAAYQEEESLVVVGLPTTEKAANVS